MFSRQFARLPLVTRGLSAQRSILRSSARFNSNDAQQKFQELLAKIQASPEIIDHMKKLQDLIIDKGLLPKVDPANPKPMGMTEQIKILMDADVRNHLAELGVKMNQAGIEVTRKDVSILMSLLKSDM